MTSAAHRTRHARFWRAWQYPNSENGLVPSGQSRVRIGKGAAASRSRRNGCISGTRRWIIVVITPPAVQDARSVPECGPAPPAWRLSPQPCGMRDGSIRVVARVESLQRMQNFIDVNEGAVLQLTHRRQPRNCVHIRRPRGQQGALLVGTHPSIGENFVGPLEYRMSRKVSRVVAAFVMARKVCHLRFSAIGTSRQRPGGKSQV